MRLAAEDWIRFESLTAAQLKTALASIPEDYTLRVNTVGNLLVTRPDGRYAGFIDFRHGGSYESLDADIQVTT